MKIRIFNEIRLTLYCIRLANETITILSEQSLEGINKDAFTDLSLFQCFIADKQPIGGTFN